MGIIHLESSGYLSTPFISWYKHMVQPLTSSELGFLPGSCLNLQTKQIF